jgi:hypothetical protein
LLGGDDPVNPISERDGRNVRPYLPRPRRGSRGAFRRSAGTMGSGSSATGAISSVTTSRASAPASLSEPAFARSHSGRPSPDLWSPKRLAPTTMIDGDGRGKPRFVDMADALEPEPSASWLWACWTHVGFSLQVEKEQPDTPDSCGIHIVSVLLPYCQSCSQFAPG